MASIKEELWKILEQLKNEEVKKFKWLLTELEPGDGFPGISVSRLEDADRQDIVDAMVQRYGGPGALRRSTEILKKISRNDLVRRLNGSNLRDLKILESESKAKTERIKAEIKQMIQKRQMKIGEMKRSAEIIRKSADRQTSDSLKVFSVLMELVQKSLSDLRENIEKKQKAAQKHVEDVIRGLEKEIAELEKMDSELLVPTDDNFPIFNEAPPPLPSYETSVETSVDELNEKLNNEMKKFLNKSRLNRIQQFGVDVTLDPETAHPNLVLSDDRKQVHFSRIKRNLPDTAERFSTAINVMGKRGFSSGKFYFEVQVKGKTRWDLGVVDESINRKGSIKANPKDGFWVVFLRDGSKYEASSVRLNVKTPPDKIGVFVDFEMKLIHFYDADSGEQIHAFTSCSFKKKLYPFFCPGLLDQGRNQAPLVICPVPYTL